MKTRFLITLMLLMGAFMAFGQMLPERGVPMLKGYTADQYLNMGKIWSIRSAPSGIVYMAADKGLLEYDGNKWNSFRGSNGFTRSVLVKNDSLIYTGSDLDFGVWVRDHYRNFHYTSLYPFQQEVQDVNEEFWQVHLLGEDIVFVSSQNIYVYKNQQIVRLAAPTRFTNSFWASGVLYFVDEKQGLFSFSDFSLRNVFAFPEENSYEITGIYHSETAMVVVTRDLGLFAYEEGRLTRINNELSEKLKVAKVFGFEMIGENHVAFGTVLRGLYIADLDGNIIHHVNRHKGLPGSTVLSMYFGTTGKLWLGMDYGIVSLDLNSQYTYFYDFRGDFGTGHAASLMDDTFYLGTNQGLYRSAWDDLNNHVEFFRFALIPNSEGQVWTLHNVDNTLLMGHDKGLFMVRENSIEPIYMQDGVWTILPFGDYLLTGNYNGISVFSKSGNTWSFVKKMELILGSANQLIMEAENVLWINIPNFGVIKATLDHEMNPVDRQIFTHDMFQGNDIWLMKNDIGIQVLTDQAQYLFNTFESNFSPVAKTITRPQVNGLLTGVYHSFPLHPMYEFFPVYNGFAFRFLGEHAVGVDHVKQLTIRQMDAFSNHKTIPIYSGGKVPYHLNNFRIKSIVPNQSNVLYQYRLNDTDDWSPLSSDPLIELLNLSHGRHTLSVRAISEEQVIDMDQLIFYVSTPWYRTWYANISYALLFALLFYSLVIWQKMSLRKQKEQLLLREQNALRQQSEKHEQEILHFEQERLQIEYDQLKQQLKNKTVELANKARDNEEKNKLLLTLKEKCERAQKNPEVSRIKWSEMQRLLDSYLKVEDKTFEIQMDELHQEFFKKLKDDFPGLSNNDLRLCAYLKIGLNSKEIAEILNIQPSSSYISRSRLRKKLNLNPEQDLFDFLNGI